MEKVKREMDRAKAALVVLCGLPLRALPTDQPHQDTGIVGISTLLFLLVTSDMGFSHQQGSRSPVGEPEKGLSQGVLNRGMW